MFKKGYMAALEMLVRNGIKLNEQRAFMYLHEALYPGVIPSLPDSVWEEAHEEDYQRWYWEDDPNDDGDYVEYDAFEGEGYDTFCEECSMCGVRRVLNRYGRCSQCEHVWNS